MPTGVIQRSFVAGELSPSFGARADLAQYHAGLRECRNFFVRRPGGVSNRAGTKFLGEVKDSSQVVRLFKFVFGFEEVFLIEAGEDYFRFWKNDELVMDGSDPFEVVTPYAAADLPLLRIVQSGTTATLTHKDYAPRELVWGGTGDTDFTLSLVVTAPGIAAPGSLTGDTFDDCDAGVLVRKYKVTAVKTETLEESLPSSAVTLVAVATHPTEERPDTLSWGAVADAVEYRIYMDPHQNGTFGYLQTVIGAVTFRNTGFSPDFYRTPPQARVLFVGANTYPHCAAYYLQRRVFANSHAEVEKVWASKIGFLSNYSIRSPLLEDDAVTFDLAANDVQAIQHMVPLGRLVLLTDNGEWVVNGDEAGSLTPFQINARQRGYTGSSALVPVVVGSSIVYVQARATVVKELRFSEGGGLEERELSLYADHLFKDHNIEQLTYAKLPDSIVWAVRSDGALVGMTYLPDFNIWGWHKHDTGTSDAFESVIALPDQEREDSVYFSVRRTVDGNIVRYIEKFATRRVVRLAECIFMDSAVTVTGPTTTITGLDHLEGEVVAVLADGVVIYNGDPDGDDAETYRVSGGEVALAASADLIQAGLAIRTAQIKTLPLDVAGSNVRDRKKKVQALTAIVDDSTHGFYAGPDADHLIQERRESWQASDGVVSKTLDVNLTCAWEDDGQVIVAMKDPLPLTVLAVIPSVELGG
jgi:hypothetical protein